MESDNSHLKRSNSSSYDPAKILIMDKNIKKLPMEVVGFAPMTQYNIQAPWGILNSQMLSSPFPFSSHIGLQPKQKVNSWECSLC